MNRNIIKQIEPIIEILTNLDDKKEVKKFLGEILTDSEMEILSKRWRIMEMLSKGNTQRAIAQKINVSLCKITRGSKILKNKNAICTKFLLKENNYDTTSKI